MVGETAPEPASLPGRNVPVAPHPPIARYYAGAADKRSFVRRLFDGGAGDYDRVERLMALGSGPWYRRQALTRAGLRPGMAVLDVATGTGLVAREAAGIVGPAGRVVGLDPSPGMVGQAARSLAIPFVLARAEELPCAGDRFDFLSMGYALRHVSDLAATFREFFRVLRPGGLACALEITRPRGAVPMAFLRLYMRGVVPLLSRVARVGRWRDAARAGDGTPRATADRPDPRLLWEYYWDTIEACVEPAAVLGAMTAAGFVDVRRSVELGVFSEYIGRKPGPADAPAPAPPG